MASGMMAGSSVATVTVWIQAQKKLLAECYGRLKKALVATADEAGEGSNGSGR